VPRLSQHYGKPPQTPYGRIEPPTKNSLILLPRQATLADVKELKYSATNAEVRRNYPLAKQFWIRVLAVSPADPEAIEGIERLVQVAATPQPPSQATEPKTETGRGVEARIESPLPNAVKRFAGAALVNSTSPLKSPTPSAVPRYEFEVVTVNAQGQITQREQKSAEYRREDLGQGISLDLVLIPGGTFMMGSPASEPTRHDDNEGPQHRVTIQPFLMGKYPVTQAQWKAVVALPKVEHDLDPDPANFKGDNRPVEQVSWDDAVEFCKRLSKQTGRKYRLPSEAEWEYACRAGTTTPFHCGETITTDLANYDGHSYSTYGSSSEGQYRKQTTDVESFKIANAFGLYDMHGNVQGWCLDYWHKGGYGGWFKNAPTDGSAWTTGGNNTVRVVRGGCWSLPAHCCRSARRIWGMHYRKKDDIGFRIVCASSWIL